MTLSGFVSMLRFGKMDFASVVIIAIGCGFFGIHLAAAQTGGKACCHAILTSPCSLFRSECDLCKRYRYPFRGIVRVSFVAKYEGGNV